MALTIAVVPAGAWGTALALPAAQNATQVRLWRRAPGWAPAWDRGHKALPDLHLPDHVSACDHIADAVTGADLVILGPVSGALREHCRMMAPHLKPGAVIVSIVKGIEPGSHLRMSQVVAQEIPSHQATIVALSGPNFAHEVAAGLPTGTVVAGENPEAAAFVQAALMTSRFRVYTNPDIIGVELAGALKNVVALGVGISDGLQMGDNARAALITRGLTEMGRLGAALGANPVTFSGLAGMGDLVLTCTGDSSRNRRAGLAIGRGQSASAFVQDPGMTVEGIPTTRAAWTLAQEVGVAMPITEAIYRLLYEELSPMEGMNALMGRQKRHEAEEIDRT